MFRPQDTHSELDILWFMVLYLLIMFFFVRSYLLCQFFVFFFKVANAQLEALRIENRHLRDSALNDQLTVSF